MQKIFCVRLESDHQTFIINKSTLTIVIVQVENIYCRPTFNHMKSNQYILVKPRMHTLTAIKNLARSYSYVFVSELEKFNFPFLDFDPGVYEITSSNSSNAGSIMICPIRNFAYLAFHGLVKPSKYESDDLSCCRIL